MREHRPMTLTLFLLSALLSTLFCAALPAGTDNAVATSAAEDGDGSGDHIAWWRAARFGLFVHWGPVSLKGTEIGWSRHGERRGRSPAKGGIPAAEYDGLYRTFNPKKFDADAWVRIAREAGMKYLVFTTKHHDGFVNFDSKLTDYKITSSESPFGRDIVAELSEACRRGGLRLGFYYSQPDWHHADYRKETHDRYITYLHGQVEELLTGYGKIDIFWFDGLGTKPEYWDAAALLGKMRRLQPHLVINNRCGLPADFDTPEQRIGAFRNDRPWETCMTICRQWAWKPDDIMKPLDECIRTMVRVVGGDGNFLFNVGPMPDGRIEPRQAARLREMGEWLEKYGESIYGTRGGPFTPGSWGVSTHCGEKIYVHVLHWGEEDILLPPIDRKVLAVSLLTGGEAGLTQTEKGIRLTVPAEYRRPIDTIIRLDLDGPAAGIPPVSMERLSLAFKGKGRASNVFKGKKEYGPDKAFDGDGNSRWATDFNTSAAWLEVDLGTPRRFSHAVILEAYGGRVKGYQLQRFSEGEWKTFFRGEGIGDRADLRFAPVTARRVRLDILEATEGPTIREFLLFE
jgi:alpha-L-fucosidase